LRDTIIARITELWNDDCDKAFDFKLNQVDELSNKELLNLFEVLIEFKEKL
jgi:hypothetical protein